MVVVETSTDVGNILWIFYDCLSQKRNGMNWNSFTVGLRKYSKTNGILLHELPLWLPVYNSSIAITVAHSQCFCIKDVLHRSPGLSIYV